MYIYISGAKNIQELELLPSGDTFQSAKRPLFLYSARFPRPFPVEEREFETRPVRILRRNRIEESARTRRRSRILNLNSSCADPLCAECAHCIYVGETRVLLPSSFKRVKSKIRCPGGHVKYIGFGIFIKYLQSIL